MESTDKGVQPPASGRRVEHFAPADEPAGIPEVADRLFGAYTVDGGTVHLAGCRLEDRLFVRAECQQMGRSVVFHLDEHSGPVDPVQVERLGMGRTVRLRRPPEPVQAKLARLRELAARLLAQRFPPEHPPEQIDLAAVWCKWTSGKLRFSIGSGSVDLPFSGWARLIEPPPYRCPITGAETFHLAAIDDGQIVAAEKIGVCAETGRRVVVDELVTCSATGRRVVAEATETCPITGKPVLRTVMVPCDACHERLAPAAVRDGRCEACRTLAPVSKADPRLALVLDQHPLLESWRHWRLAETATVYVLTAAAWLRRLLVVIDKESLDLKRVATGSRLGSGWRVVEPSEHDTAMHV